MDLPRYLSSVWFPSGQRLCRQRTVSTGDVHRDRSRRGVYPEGRSAVRQRRRLGFEGASPDSKLKTGILSIHVRLQSLYKGRPREACQDAWKGPASTGCQRGPDNGGMPPSLRFPGLAPDVFVPSRYPDRHEGTFLSRGDRCDPLNLFHYLGSHAASSGNFREFRASKSFAR